MAASGIRRPIARLREEHGMSMVELVVAIFIVTLVIGALADLFVQSNDSSYSSQRLLSRVSILQSQIERVRRVADQYGFSGVALTSAPGAATDTPLPRDPTNPDDFVSGSGCSRTFTVLSNYNLTTEAFPTSQTVADSPEPLLVNGCTVSGNAISGGQLAPVQYADLSTGAVSSTAPAGDPYATVYTFVTQTTMAGCNSSLGSCTGDVRRVIVAVVLNRQAADLGTNYPAYATTVFSNPTASDQANQASGLRILGLIS